VLPDGEKFSGPLTGKYVRKNPGRRRFVLDRMDVALVGEKKGGGGRVFSRRAGKRGKGEKTGDAE